MASAQPEPSMEEILASIRRIISEDDDDGGAAGDIEYDDVSDDEPSPEGLVSDNLASITPMAEPVAERPTFVETPVVDTAGADEPEKLDASSIVESPASPVAEAFSEPAGHADDEDVSVERMTRSDPAADLSTMVGATDVLANSDARTGAGGATVSGETEMTNDAAAAIGAELPSDRLGLTGSDVDLSGEAMVDELSATVAGEAFRSLNQTIRVSAQGERTLEDMVTDLLKPMIKDWLDKHLPAIVEEKVQDEVQRIARRSR